MSYVFGLKVAFMCPARHRSFVVGLGFAATIAIGGCSGANDAPALRATAMAESYDATSSSWRAVAPMNGSRQGHAAILLGDGRVLVSGGRSPGQGYADNQATAEIFDPKTETWQSAGAMADARHGHTATLLPDGSVLITGGEYPQTGSCEIFDPKTGVWHRAASMHTPRDRYYAVQLADGRILVSGGFSHPRGGKPVADAEIYDSAHDAWSKAAPMTSPRAYHVAVVLGDGQVLVAGGETGEHPPPRDNLATAERYDPKLDRWRAVAPMSVQRAYGQTGSLLPGGSVLLAGGEANARYAHLVAALAGTEAYDPALDTWQTKATMRAPRHFHTATLLADGKLLACGGQSVEVPTDTAERYDAASGKWTSAGRMGTPRTWQSATRLRDGRVLVAGGLTPVHATSKPPVESAANVNAPDVPKPEILADGQQGPSDLVVDATHVYWTNRGSGTLVKLAKAGGKPAVIAADHPRIGRLVVDASHVYWTSGAKIMRARKDGTEIAMLATAETRGARGPSGLAVDQAHLYWTNYSDADGTVMRVGKAGGVPDTLAAQQDGPFYVAVDSTSLYWTNHSGEGKAVMKVPLSGGEPLPIARGQSNPTFIAVDDDAVYWTNLAVGSGKIMRWDKNTGDLKILADGQVGPSAIALDSMNVYWTSLALAKDRWATRSWVLATRRKRGGKPRVLAEAPEHFWGLAVDEHFVDWTSYRAGTVSKIATQLSNEP